jgi:hypothetical protein
MFLNFFHFNNQRKLKNHKVQIIYNMKHKIKMKINLKI